MKHIITLVLSCLLFSCTNTSIDAPAELWSTQAVYNNADSTEIAGYQITKYNADSFNGVVPTTVNGKKIIAIGSIVRGKSILTNPKDTSFTLLDLTHAHYLETLDESAFAGSRNLKSIILNKELKTVKNGTFADCQKLESITWNKTIDHIGEAAFYNCDALTHVEIPNAVDTIGEFAFYACANLENVVFNNQVKYIGMRAFANNGKLKSLDLPVALTYIGEKAFLNARLIRELTIPSHVKEIGKKAFFQCKALQKLTLKNKLGTKIAKQAFDVTPIADSEDAKIYYPKSTNYPEMDNWNTFNARWLAE